MKTTLFLVLLAVVAAFVCMAPAAAKQLVMGIGEKVHIALTRYQARQGMILGANFYGDIQTVANGPAYGQPLTNRVKSNKMNGRIRFAEFMFVAPPSGTAPAIADKIIWGKLPTKARIIGHLSKLYWTAGTASCTLNLGDSTVAARHLAATAITTAGSAVPEAASLVQSAVGDVTINSAVIQNVKSIGAFQLGANITGTGIPAGATIAGIDYNSKMVTLSVPATATNAALALVVNGGAYETQDDSNSAGNAFGGTTDDSTLVSTVAGAQIANNQVLVLKVAYVTD